MCHVNIIFGLILLLSVMSCAPHDPVQPEIDIRLDDWEPTSANQLLSDHVSSLAVNSRHIWVGTDRGVSRYDKAERQWNNFTIKNGLANNDVSAIALDGEEVWIGTSGGISRYHTRTEKWTRYMPHDGLADRNVTCIVVDSRFVWFGTPKGLSRYDKETNSWTRKREADGLAGDKVKKITVDGEYLWVATETGVSRYDKLTDSWSNYDKDTGLVDDHVSAIAADEDLVWFGTENKGVSLYDVRNSEFVRTYTKRDWLASDQIRALAVDGTSLWLGTADSGAQRYILSVNAWRQYTIEEGLPSNHITAIAADGNVVWFGTHEHGLVRYDLRREKWTRYGEVQTLSDNDVKSLLASSTKVWVGTRDGLNKYTIDNSSHDWRTISKADGLADNYITSVAERGDTLWVGTPQGLGVRGGEGKWRFYTTKDGLADNFVTCLAWDLFHRQLWVGTKAGLSTYNPSTDSWHTLSPASKLPGQINDIHLSGEAIWIATPNGLVYYNRLTETSARLSKKDGLPGNWVNTISISSDSLWVGTRLGLVRLQDLSDSRDAQSRFSLAESQLVSRPSGSGPRFDKDVPFHVSHFRHPTARANVRVTANDGDGIWIGTPQGLARYNVTTDRWKTYTRENTSDKLAANNIAAISITETDVWIGTIDGVSRFDKMTQQWTKHVAPKTTEILRANQVTRLAEDGDFIWFINWKGTTEGAIGQYDRGTKMFRFFSKEDLPLQPNAPPITLIHGITVDEGVVWFGTNAGMLRYDKVSDSWRHYTTRDGLPNNEVWSITLDDAHIWTLHIGGVVCRHSIKENRWQYWEISPSAVWSTLGKIAVDPQYVWVSTAWEGIKRFDKLTEEWVTFAERDGLGHSETNDIFIDDDYVWITAWGDVSRYDRHTEEWESLSDDRVLSNITFGIHAGIDGFWMLYSWWRNWGEPVASKYHYSTQSWSELKTPRINRGRNHDYNEWLGSPMQLIETPDNVWLAIEESGVARYNKAAKDWRFFTYETGLASNWLIEGSMVVDSDYVWVGTGDGLCQYDIKRDFWTTFTYAPMAEASSPRKVYAIAAEDRYLWMGSPTGLHRYDKQKNQWTRHRYEEDLVWGVKSLAVDEKYLWLGTDGGVRRYDKAADRSEAYTEKNGLPSNVIRDVDVEGYDLWIATDDGAARFNRLSDDSNAWETHLHSLEIKAMGSDQKYAHTLLSNDLRCVTMTEDSVWFGTEGGVCRYDRKNQTWEPLSTMDELNVTDISTIAIDGDNIWFGTNRGVTKYDTVSGNTVNYTPINGLASHIVTCIAVNRTEIWFGSANAGVSRLDKATGKWQIIDTRHGLLHNRVEAIAFDGDQIWFGTEFGLCRYDRKVGTWTSYAEAFEN